MTDSDQSGFLPEYRSISNKLKKRFLRKPNVSEASEQFRQLGKRLEDNQEPQYAAYCHLAIGQYQSQSKLYENQLFFLVLQEDVNRQ